MAFAEGLLALGLLAVPVFFYPFSKLCWLAFDLIFRPPRPEDFEA